MSASHHRDVEVFTEALQLPAAERAAYLERACGGDMELRQRVEGLLAAHREVGDFLEDPAETTSMRARWGVSVGEEPGDRIDHYRLLQQIGEGGCGVVFLAEQEEPVRRQVALKIIKPGMDTKSVIARFQAERQVLALMDHPNIAKVFDAGATKSGRPYFVMELIRGIKITEYCDQRSLTTAERLKLFVQVCQAIQHAHQKGIIHRDIKPSNILVTTTTESAALPVVIDFGIAKATTNQRLTDKTIFTALEMLIGTPAYMSPEQAELTSMDADTRTDIYSLGVLLYELLTGSTPFDSGELLKAGLDEIRRVIREQEPLRPSTRLSNLTRADLTALARQRKSEPPTLIRVVRGDLDWIVMKALEKDRTRRYGTADGLALDVRRYLAEEPVLARPPSKLYRLQKTALRNKLLFIGIGVIAMLLVMSLIVVSASLAKERRARREADSDRKRAQQVTKFLKAMLNGVGPSAAQGRDTAMLREILDQTAESIGKEMSGQPAVEAELSTLIGQLYYEIGNYEAAAKMHRAALRLHQQLSGTNSPEAAAVLKDLGLALSKEGNNAGAERAHMEALAILRRHFGNENADVAIALNNLATVFRHQKRLVEAEAMIREALAIGRKICGSDCLAVADTLHNLCALLGDEGKRDECETTAREALAMRVRLLGPKHEKVASALADVAWAASGAGKLNEAEAMYREALAMRRELLGDTHPDSLAALHNLILTLAAERKWPEVETVQRQALAAWRKRGEKEGPNALQAMCDLGLTLVRQGKASEAEAVWREILTLMSTLKGNEPPQTLFILRDVGLALESGGKWSEAESIWLESLTAWRKRAGNDDPQTLYTLRKLGLAYEAEKKWSEAEAIHREAFVSSRRLAGDKGPEALVDLERLARVLIAQKEFGEAEKLLNEVLTSEFVQDPASAGILIQKVNLLGRQGQWQEAAASAAQLVDLQPTDHYNYHRLAALLAITHNRPAYQQLCQRLLTNFANPTNPYIAERMAVDCLLLPDAEVDLTSVDKLADIALTVGNHYEDVPYFQACKAMSNYRLGRFPAAIEWGEKVIKSSLVYAQAKAYAVLAMAHWRLGHKEAARATLAKGDALAPSIVPGRGAEDLGESWVAWLCGRIQLDEASALIQTRLPARDEAGSP